MAQKIPMQELPPQMDPEPEMGAAAAEAAVYDTSPPLPHQNPSPIPAETVHPSEPDMAQLCAMLVGVTAAMQQMQGEIKNNTNEMNGNAQQMESKMDGMKEEIKNNTQAFKSDMRALRGGTWQVGRCLQAGKMATPRAGSSELKGSAPAGEDRVSRETCWARRVEVTDGNTDVKGGRDHVHERDKTGGDRADGDTGGRRETAQQGRGRGRGGRTHTHRDSEGQWG